MTRFYSLIASLTLLSAISRAAPLRENDKRQGGLYVPFYGTSANGHNSSARGWNTFGLQANPATNPGFVFNDFHFAQQCDNIVPRVGGDYYCSLDSGWSGNGGDPFGRLQPEPSVFTSFSPVLKGLADHLHSKSLKLGVYVLPGAFEGDQDVTIEGTNIRLGDVLDFDQPGYNLRRSFKWGQPGVQEWHDSVIKNFASLGVDFIKIDFVTPGEDLPTDTSMAVVNYHNSIQRLAPGVRIDVSWKLDRTEPFFSRWQASGDTIRTDQDINNHGTDERILRPCVKGRIFQNCLMGSTFVSWEVTQRAINNYRLFINEQTQNVTRHGLPIRIRPDMDNMYTGNPTSVSGISDVERYTMAITWIGAGANLITGSDMTNLDDLGRELLNNDEALDVADFTAQFPMQPRNPTDGGVAAKQLQAWVAGPDTSGTAVVVLSNYGPDLGQGGFGESIQGVQVVSVSLDILGLGGSSWSVRRVWGGGGSGGSDHTDVGVTADTVSASLGPGESVLYRLKRQ